MLKKLRFNKAILSVAIAGLVACSADDGDTGLQGLQGEQGPQGEQGSDGADATTSEISLKFLGRHESGQYDESAAEIVAFDPSTDQVFVVNSQSGNIDVIDISAPATPVAGAALDLATDISGAVDGLDASGLGAANSVAVRGNTVAVAVEAATKQDPGYVAFYQTDGTFLSAVMVGALPDMLTFTPNGNTLLVANEGEPNGDYSSDPDGTVSVIDVSGGAASVGASNVTTISFEDFNSDGTRAAELDSAIRISAKALTVQADLEPEYIAVSEDGTKAWVAMQENNALATINLSDNSITSIKGLGAKNHAILGNELDASNKDNSINITSWPVRGLYMPDSIDSFSFAGVDYVITANEGDAREYLTKDVVDDAACTGAGGFDFDDGDCLHYLDEIRLKDIEDTGATIDIPDLTRFATDVATLSDDANLGRLKIVADMGVEGTCATLATTGQPGADCTYTQLYSYGARSFSIWNGATGELVFDSGSDFEKITASRLGDGFNSSNDENDIGELSDNRSDDKGPEPEAVEIATIEGKTYAFIGLERVGGIMVYDISNPQAAHFVQYINTRDFSVDVENNLSDAGDLGPESILYVPAGDSPNNSPLLIVGNEVSGTTAIFEITVVAAAQ